MRNTALLMRVAVVDIGTMCVSMDNWRVAVFVAMRAIREHAFGVVMAMLVVVVGVEVCVHEEFVLMFVVVILAEMQPDAEHHEEPSRNSSYCDRLTEDNDRYDDAHEWSNTEVRAGARGAKMA